MLIKFAVANYRGFNDKVAWSLNRPSNYSFNTFAIKDGIVKNGIVYGPNGSGKSNFALALFDIVNHLSQRWKKADYYDNFVYAGSEQPLVHFHYTFKFGEDELDYTYQKDANGKIKAEELSLNGEGVFVRKGKEFSINDKEFPMDDAVKKGLAENANDISVVNFLLTSYPLPEKHYLIRLQTFVNSMLWFRCLETREFIGLVTAPVNLDEFIISKGLVNDFSDFIKRVSEQSFDFIPPSEGDKVLLCSFDAKKVPFDKIASTGTLALMLLYYWIKQMSSASFVFIDEFDAFYHYRLSYEVCKLLFSLDCQAFTSSHNTYLMSNDLLRPDCNFIINNNKIKPLNECTNKELRFGHNIEKLFRGNAFSL
ncbi:AAA family ATPase [Segatella maculosa]|uniref:AAA family ATPase n=1 Tax=Segatella maculosa TaxID=439703 RepID=UPI00036FBF61|nr:AAA family ATPase [Segatella maculosa]